MRRYRPWSLSSSSSSWSIIYDHVQMVMDDDNVIVIVFMMVVAIVINDDVHDHRMVIFMIMDCYIIPNVRVLCLSSWSVIHVSWWSSINYKCTRSPDDHRHRHHALVMIVCVYKVSVIVVIMIVVHMSLIMMHVLSSDQ